MLGKSCILSKLSTATFSAYNSLFVREKKKTKKQKTMKQKIKSNTTRSYYYIMPRSTNSRNTTSHK